MPKPRRPSAARGRAATRDVKDRLVQTRVPEHLEDVLKKEAKRRRLTVSHLIRNMIEDTLDLVDTVVAGAGDIIDTAADAAGQVKRDAERVATTARDVMKSRTPEEPGKGRPAPPAAETAVDDRVTQPSNVGPTVPPGDSLDHVLAWNAVVVNRPAKCASCGTELPKGTPANLGVTTDPGLPPTWLCASCLARL